MTEVMAKLAGGGDADPEVIAQFERSLSRVAMAVAGAGLLAAICYVLPYGPKEAIRIFGAALATAGVAAALGGALGFLFGIPKTLQSDQLDGKPIRYLANTNLEDISDWLTKIIVGVGLIQISKLPMALRRRVSGSGRCSATVRTAPRSRSASPGTSPCRRSFSSICGRDRSYEACCRRRMRI